MSDPKRHHYLPQSYLRAFGRDDGVWVYDRKINKVRWQKIKDTALESYFYSIELKDGLKDNKTIETELSKIEGAVSKISEKLRDRQELNLEERVQVCLFAAFMMNRTPDFREGIQRIEGKLLKRVAQQLFCSEESTKQLFEGSNNDFPDTSNLDAKKLHEIIQSDSFDIKIHKNRSLEMMVKLASGFTKTLLRLNWAILHAPKNCNFITTDRPFVIVPPKDRSRIPKWAGVGLLTPGANKFLPLTADMTIVFGDPGDTFGHIHVNKADVMQINGSIGNMTQRFLIGKDEALIKSWVKRLKLSESVPVQTMTVG